MAAYTTNCLFRKSNAGGRRSVDKGGALSFECALTVSSRTSAAWLRGGSEASQILFPQLANHTQIEFGVYLGARQPHCEIITNTDRGGGEAAQIILNVTLRLHR